MPSGLTDFEKEQITGIRELSKSVTTLAVAYFAAAPAVVSIFRSIITNGALLDFLRLILFLLYVPMALSIWYGNRLQRHMIWQLAAGNFDAYRETMRDLASRQLGLFFYSGLVAVLSILLVSIGDFLVRVCSSRLA